MNVRLLIAMLAAVAMVFVVGCNDDDKIVESERTSIERYLTSSHQPRLIPKEEVENSIEYNPPFYEKLSMDVYRYIATYYDANREQREEVEEGDVVELTVTAYIFAGRAPSISSVYFTNEESVLKSLSSEGLNTEYWTTEPVVVKLGESSIIKGVEQSLLGCREGDKVEVYMTHNAAYEDKAMGILKKESPVMWIYTITNLIKN